VADIGGEKSKRVKKTYYIKSWVINREKHNSVELDMVERGAK
jgi:hypothetical protein